MSADGDPWVGRPLRRGEDAALLRGEGVFVDDVAPSEALHMVVVRSRLAHARLAGVRSEAALEVPSVLAVVTGADLGDAGPMPVISVEGSEMALSAAIPRLAREVVRFAGEPVAAGPRREPERGGRWRRAGRGGPGPSPGDPRPDRGTALRGPPTRGRARKRTPAVASLEWRGGRQFPASGAGRRRPLPDPAAGGDADGAEGMRRRPPARRGQPDVVVLGPGLPPAAGASRRGPARPAEGLRVIVPDVGGAFGSKTPLAPEHAVVAELALHWGRPVKWVEDRWENFVGAYHGRGIEAEVELALNGDGLFSALRARLVADLGAYLYPATATTPVTTAMLLTGAYDIPAAEVDVTGVATNKVPTGPYRGAGRPEAAFVIERMVDLTAVELGMDPAEVRRRNLVPADRFPHRTPLGYTYDSGDYLGALDRARDLVGYARRRREQRAARGRGRLVGVGLALFVAQAAPLLWESAWASLLADGRVEVRTGASPQGQGHATAFAQIAADAMGIAPQDVEVRYGDSAAVPAGVGTFGSRSVTVAGSAVLAVVQRLRARVLSAAAEALEVAEDDLRWEGGRFVVAGAPDRSVGLAELAEIAARDRPGASLDAEATFRLPGPVFPFGAYAAVVEIEREAGSVRVLRLVAVNDVGTVVNPLLAEGQVHGSILQGLAATLSEEAVYDPEGQLLTGSMTTYGVPSPADLVVELRHEFRRTPSPHNPLGAKGIGESGTIGAPAAVANAVADALAPLGVQRLDPPFTPERVWLAIRDAGRP